MKQSCLPLILALAGSSGCLFSQVVYVANSSGRNVSAYTINASSGALTAVPGQPFQAGSAPASVAVHPSGKFVYVVNAMDNTVSAYTVNPGSGALTAVPGSPFPSVSPFFSGSVAVDPIGKFAYVTTHLGDTVSAYTINAASGALTAVPGSPFKAALTSTSIALAVHPSGRFVYLPGPQVGNSPTVLAYAIDTGSGALKAIPGSPFPTVSPELFALDPAGKFLYIDDGRNFAAYAINTTSGALTPVPSRPLDMGSFITIQGMAVDPAGKFVYLTTYLPDMILAYAINASTGTLTPVPGSPYPGNFSGLSSHPGNLAVDPAGKFVYVINYPPFDAQLTRFNGISAYAINPGSGALTPVPGSPFPGGNLPVAIAIHNLPAAPAPPAITSLAPTSTTAGGPAFTLAVTGTGFLSGVVVQWNGSPLSTTFSSATQLSAAVPANLIAAVGSANIAVANPDGTVSKSVSFAINPVGILISASGVVNAASQAGGAVSAGEIVTISGAGFGSSAQAVFDGVTAPRISAQAGQITVVVPYAVNGNDSTQLQISDQGQNSSAVPIPVAAAAPGIFTADGSGSGQGVIFNEDGTANAPGNAAAAGSTVVVSATGGGQTDPPGVDGKTADSPAPVPLLTVTATVGGLDATVAGAGGVPGMIAGYLQVSVQIPPDVTVGDSVAIVLHIGGIDSQAGVTLAIQ